MVEHSPVLVNWVISTKLLLNKEVTFIHGTPTQKAMHCSSKSGRICMFSWRFFSKIQCFFVSKAEENVASFSLRCLDQFCFLKSNRIVNRQFLLVTTETCCYRYNNVCSMPMLYLCLLCHWSYECPNQQILMWRWFVSSTLTVLRCLFLKVGLNISFLATQIA